jgi:hypothetical protein
MDVQWTCIKIICRSFMGGEWNFTHEIGVVKKDTIVPLGLSSHKGEK